MQTVKCFWFRVQMENNENWDEGELMDDESQLEQIVNQYLRERAQGKRIVHVSQSTVNDPKAIGLERMKVFLT